MGSYVVQAGDSPTSMSGKFWGNQRHFLDIIRANGGRIMFHPGETIQVPDVPSEVNPVISEASIQALRNAGMWGPAASGSGGSTPAATPRPTNTLTSADGANSSYRPTSGGTGVPATTPPAAGGWNPAASRNSEIASINDMRSRSAGVNYKPPVPQTPAVQPVRNTTYLPQVSNGTLPPPPPRPVPMPSTPEWKILGFKSPWAYQVYLDGIEYDRKWNFPGWVPDGE